MDARQRVPPGARHSSDRWPPPPAVRHTRNASRPPPAGRGRLLDVRRRRAVFHLDGATGKILELTRIAVIGQEAVDALGQLLTRAVHEMRAREEVQLQDGPGLLEYLAHVVCFANVHADVQVSLR